MLKSLRDKHKLLALFVLTLFIMPFYNLARNTESMTMSSNILDLSYPQNLDRIIPIETIFVGFNKDVIDLSYIEEKLTMRDLHIFANGTVKYRIDFELRYADNYTQREIFDFIDKIKKEDTTSDLLENELGKQLYMVLNGNLSYRTKVFNNIIHGYSIDAVLLENKLNELSPSTNDRFYLYVLNLSYLDNIDSGQDHWFTVNVTDPDSNKTRDFWRLEWDNSLNSPVRFPFSAFNMKHRVLFIDPTSYNWYLNWTRIWWGISNFSKYPMYWSDLDHFIRKLNLSYYEDIRKVNDFLIRWIKDFLDDLVLRASTFYLNPGSLYINSLSIQLNVINMRPDIVPTSRYSWTISKDKIMSAIRQIYPSISMTFRIGFYETSRFPKIAEILKDNIYRVESNWTYYDGASIYRELNELRGRYFNENLAEKNLVGWIFILYNSSMVVMNREFTGLGGNGFILIMMEAKRILGENLSDFRQGFTLVINHELGHAIGLTHTFSSSSYASDFVFDVMGYYSGSWNYSRIRLETFQREINDDMLLSIYSELNSLLKNISSSDNFDEINGILTGIDGQLDKINFLQNTTRYKDAFLEIKQVKEKIITLKALLNNSTGDNRPENPPIRKNLLLILIFTVFVATLSIIVLISWVKSKSSFTIF